MGARALLAMMGGTISLHGKNRVEWSHLGARAAAGATSITMSESVDWQPGEFIVIASSRTNWNEAEKREITQVSSDGRTVQLRTALAFPHAGVTETYIRSTDNKQWTANLRAEVGLLSRNITIRGAQDSVTVGHPNEGFGAHIMVHGPMTMNGVLHPSAIATIKGVEITRAGQKSLGGRYPFHWHLCMDKGQGQYFSDNVVHQSFNRAITIHGTDYATVENNFCYDHIGHGMFLEDGGERFNIIKKNVVLLTKKRLRHLIILLMSYETVLPPVIGSRIQTIHLRIMSRQELRVRGFGSLCQRLLFCHLVAYLTTQARDRMNSLWVVFQEIQRIAV
jgi:hypothetical protein